VARLLIVHHTPSPPTHTLLEAVRGGATHRDLADAGIEVALRPALGATVADVLDADGYLLGTPANLGYMSGALKHFFDTVYYPCLDATVGRPVGLWVHGNNDTGGAVSSVERIVVGLRWRWVAEPLAIMESGAILLHLAEKTGIAHAQCWAHCRREFFKAQAVEPELAGQALARIGRIYEIEEDIRTRKLAGANKHLHRLTHSKSEVEAFFEWVRQRLEDQALLPTSRFVQALGYAHARRHALSLFLGDPELPVDTNHLERSLRPIPLGRKNWMFSWTELGARQIGIVQSLLVTCQLHDINAYDYLVDVLQRVDRHPATEVEQLTPRLWKQHFAHQRLRSEIERLAL